MKKLQTLLSTTVGAAIVTLIGASGADAITVSGAGGEIPDFGAGIFTSSVTITDDLVIDDITVNLNRLRHTWAGDLIVNLTHLETGISVDLFNRLGRSGGTGFGDSSDFRGDYSFNDSNTGDLIAVAGGLLGNRVISSGDYFSTTADGTLSFLSAFDGKRSFGTYVVTISDHAGDDVGSLDSFDLTIEGSAVVPGPSDVPEPSAVLGILVSGAFGIALKHKQHKLKQNNPDR